jgi:hypothetical protein
MQGDGNLVIYANNRALWATGTNSPGSYLVFQGDGNIVIYTASNEAVWATNTSGESTGFIIQDDGNLVLYNGNQVKWASNTSK